ncbi:MAG: MBL fold metallo-hydrolase [Phycisphaerales bacterium]
MTSAMQQLHVIDLHFQNIAGAIAAYVLETDAGPILFETGPGSTTAALEGGLQQLGYEVADLQAACVTHIHLDHAGAGGWVASHGVPIHVHEFGAKHLIDPERLLASARRIYQDRMDPLWGEFLAVPERHIVALHDGDCVSFGNVQINVIETPGHARHHHAFAFSIDGERVAVTGDAGGTFIAEAPRFMSLPTPPPEFNLNAWLHSLDVLQNEQFDALYPTHFNRVDDVASHLDRVRGALRDHLAFVEEASALYQNDAGAIEHAYQQWFERQEQSAMVPPAKWPFYCSAGLIQMNVTGMLRHLAGDS